MKKVTQSDVRWMMAVAREMRDTVPASGAVLELDVTLNIAANIRYPYSYSIYVSTAAGHVRHYYWNEAYTCQRSFAAGFLRDVFAALRQCFRVSKAQSYNYP